MEFTEGFFSIIWQQPDKRAVSVAIQKYGWHGFYALRAIVGVDKKHVEWQDYTATILWAIGRVMTGEDWKFPSYIDMAYPHLVKSDVRTSQQIKDDLIARLTK